MFLFFFESRNYHFTKNRVLIYGSEIKSILEYKDYKSEIDKEALVEYFTFQNGFKNKLYDPHNFNKNDIAFYYQSYMHPKYNKKNFVKYASILDLLFYDYPNAKDIIRSGRNWIKA